MAPRSYKAASRNIANTGSRSNLPFPLEISRLAPVLKFWCLPESVVVKVFISAKSDPFVSVVLLVTIRPRQADLVFPRQWDLHAQRLPSQGNRLNSGFAHKYCMIR